MFFKINFSYKKFFYIFIAIFFIQLPINFINIKAQAADVYQNEAPSIVQSDVINFDDTEQEEIKVLPPEPPKTPDGKEIKVGLTISIPVIGDVTLYPEKDPNTGAAQLRATLPGKQINLSPVPISFDTFELIINEGKNPSLNSRVSVFGKKATLQLVELKKETNIKTEQIPGIKAKKLTLPLKKAHFRVVFIDKPTITIIPGKTLQLNYMELIVEKGKTTTLGAEISMLGKKVDLQFEFSKTICKLTFSLPTTTLGNLISELQRTSFKDAQLKNLSVSTSFKIGAQTPTSEIQEDLATNFTATADFSSLKTNNLNLNLSNLNINAYASKDKGFHLDAEIKNLELPIIGTINNAKFVLDSAKAVEAKRATEVKAKTPTEKTEEEKDKPEVQKPATAEVSLTGNGSFEVPTLGKLDYTLAASYSDKGFELDAEIKSPVYYAGSKIDNAKLTLNPTTKTVKVNGDIIIKGFNLIANITIAPDPKDPNKKEVKFDAEVTKKTWKPFEKENVPDFLKNIVFNNLKAKLEIQKGQTAATADLSLSGDAVIYGIAVTAEAKYIKTEQGQGIFVKAVVPKGKEPDGLKKLDIKNSSLIITTIPYVDPETKLAYTPGLSLTGQITLTGILAPVGKLLGGKDQVFTISGTLNPDPRKSKLSVELTKGLPLKTSKVSIGPVALQISGVPEIELYAGITVRPSPKDEELIFKGSAALNPTEIKFNLEMDGMWKNPFGINGFAVGNLDLGLDINPEVFATTGLPSGFQMAGEIDLSEDKKIIVALSIDLVNWLNIALLGKLEGSLSLADIVTLFAEKVGAKIPKEDIPVIEIKNIEVRFAPATAQIGPITVQEGLTVKGEINILKEKLAVDFNIDKTGITAKTDMTPITLGPLTITAGKMVDGKIRQTKFGGPEIDIELTASQQKFLVSGLLEITDLFSTSADVSISKSGIEFAFETSIGPKQMFDAKVTGQSSGPISNPDFRLIIDLKQNFTEFIKEKVTKELDKAEKEIKEKIEAAIKKIDDIDKTIADNQQAIDDATKKVQDAKNKIDSLDKEIASADKQIEDAQQKLKAAQDKVNSIDTAYKSAEAEINKAQEKVNTLKSQIKGKQDKINELKKKISGGSIFDKVKNAFKRAGNTIKNTAEKAGKTIKSTAEKIGKDIKQGSEKAINVAKYSAEIAALGTEIAGLEIALKTATAALNAAKGSLVGLQASKATANEALQVAQQFLDKVVKNVNKAALIAARETAKAALTASEQFLDKVIKNIDKGVLIASRESAKGILKGAEEAGIGIMEGNKFVVKSLTQGFMINEIKFDGSLKEIEHGKLPNLLFVMHILGKEKRINLTFDFRDPEGSAKSLAKEVVKLVTP